MSSVLFSIEQNVAYITLNRPDKFNAFNREMALELQHRLDECESSGEVRSIYITGAGKGFSSGQDLTEVIDPEGPDTATILEQHYNPIVRKIRSLNKPVVAAVNGVAAGAAANIALCCDVVVAASNASFVQAFSKIGLIPDSGGTFILPRLIGWQKASALMLLAEKLTAAEAERMGMIYKVFPEDAFKKESRNIALTLAEMPAKALALTKKALLASCNNTWEQQLQLEERLQIEAGQTADFKEGISAFIEKRKPIFKGR